MRLFLPTLAVGIGPANALLHYAFGNSPWGGPFGVYLGLPLAWLLGMFGGRTAERTRSQA